MGHEIILNKSPQPSLSLLRAQKHITEKTLHKTKMYYLGTTFSGYLYLQEHQTNKLVSYIY